MKKEKLIELIRKLFNLGDKTKNSSEAEAEAATSKAQELLKKYNIDIADVIIKNNQKTVDIEIDREIVFEIKKNSFPNWMKSLMMIVGTATETRSYYSKRRKPAANRRGFSSSIFVGFVGTEWDRSVAKELFVYLFKTLNRMANRFYNGKFKDQRCFLEGFCYRLRERVNEQTQEGKVVNEKYALPVVSKKKIISDYMAGNFSKTPSRGGSRYYNLSAFQRGRSEASKIDIGISNRLKE